MKIYSNSTINAYSKPKFTGRVEKAMKLLQSTRNVKEMKITPDEAIKIYEKLGYSVSQKTGSHITLTHPKGMKFPMVLPHGGEKRYISSENVRTLQCAVFEDFNKLVQSLHYHRK